ncbi:Ig-like domain-containing protein [Hyalangium versicolor]|uniref:Ig-like domain-containing protein n=1 Tax=Hyalangium versicolor TaxID=2861190 RepID=UPI001CCE573D|nr:Ig-like domain-containing protein [Hyalangium versicolor]
MSSFNRIVPLVLAVLISACIDIPEVESPETPDGGSQPDSGVPTDTTPPTLTQITPLHGSTQVATSTLLILTFSEPMSASSVQVSITPSVTLGSSTWANGNTQLSLQPTALLTENTTYTLVVEGKDFAGNALTERTVFSFSTTGPAPDTTPPTILKSNPTSAAIGVARNAIITVAFSEPMDKASAQSAFAITSPLGFTSGVFAWNAAGTEMTFNPDTDFPYDTDVTWSVTAAANDLSANSLDSTWTATFHTIRKSTITVDFDPGTSGSASAPDYWRNHLAYDSEAVGDLSDNTQSRLLIGFKLDALPEELTAITGSTLKWYVTGMTGDPFIDLGTPLLERVYIGESIAYSSTESVNLDARIQYESSAVSPPIIITIDILKSVEVFDVTSFVALDWSARINRNTKRSQFRIRFNTPSDNDGRRDAIYSYVSQTPKLAELEITYEHP